MTERVQLNPAFVLHTRTYRETSLLVELLTRDHGRVSVIARGARGKKSRFRGLLMPFSPLLVSWAGRSQLMTLVSAEPDGVPQRLTEMALLSGFYLNELLIRLLAHGEGYPALYQLYRETLLAIEGPGELEEALRLFEWRLLVELGYGIRLDQDVNGLAIQSDRYYRFATNHGLISCANSQGVDVFSGDDLLAFHRGVLNTREVLKSAKRLMRQAFATLLDGRPLKSRELFC